MGVGISIGVGRGMLGQRAAGTERWTWAMSHRHGHNMHHTCALLLAASSIRGRDAGHGKE